jgi:Ni/Co efflux regulator RcnB
VKRLFALLVAAVLTAGVASVYAEDAASASRQGAVTTGADATQQKDIKRARKTKQHHHKAGKKRVKKTKAAATGTSEPAAQ